MKQPTVEQQLKAKLKKGGFLPLLISALPALAGMTALAGGTATAVNVKKLVKGNGIRENDLDSVIHNLLLGLNSAAGAGGFNLSAILPLLISGALGATSIAANRKGSGLKPHGGSLATLRGRGLAKGRQSRSSSVTSTTSHRSGRSISKRRSSSKKRGKSISKKKRSSTKKGRKTGGSMASLRKGNGMKYHGQKSD